VQAKFGRWALADFLADRLSEQRALAGQLAVQLLALAAKLAMNLLGEGKLFARLSQAWYWRVGPTPKWALGLNLDWSGWMKCHG